MHMATCLICPVIENLKDNMQKGDFNCLYSLLHMFQETSIGVGFSEITMALVQLYTSSF